MYVCMYVHMYELLKYFMYEHAYLDYTVLEERGEKETDRLKILDYRDCSPKNSLDYWQ